MKIHLIFILFYFSLVFAFSQANQSINFKDKSGIHSGLIIGLGVNKFKRKSLSPVLPLREVTDAQNDFIRPGLLFTLGAFREKELNKRWSWRFSILSFLRQTKIEELPPGGPFKLSLGEQLSLRASLNSSFLFRLNQNQKSQFYLIGGGTFNRHIFTWTKVILVEGLSRGFFSSPTFYLFSPFELGIYAGLGLRHEKFFFEWKGNLTNSIFFNRELVEKNYSLDLRIGYFLKK